MGCYYELIGELNYSFISFTNIDIRVQRIKFLDIKITTL